MGAAAVACNRRGQARLAWHAELWCVLLTLLYSALALSDIYIFEAPRFSSPAWFAEGFCVWESASVAGLPDCCRDNSRHEKRPAVVARAVVVVVGVVVHACTHSRSRARSLF